MARTMDESPSDEPPQRTGAFAPICLIDPDALLADADRAWLEQTAARASEHMNLRGEVRVRLLNDRAMGEAHERSMGESGPTDVLTFDLDPGSGVLDVDLLVCVDEAARRAGEFGHGVGREILLYIVHGVLHCLGHDDHDEAQARHMHQEEDRILSAIGVGSVYAPSARCEEEQD